MNVASSLSSSSIFRLQTPTSSWINKTSIRRNPFQQALFSKSVRSNNNFRLYKTRNSSPPSTQRARNSRTNDLQCQQIESDVEVDVNGYGTMADLILSVMRRLLPRLHFTSFCCVFQHMVFSCIPALTVPIMFILLATLPPSDLSVLRGEDGCSSSVEEKEEEESEEREAMVWKKITEEAARLVAKTRHEALMDQETIRRFVSPLTVEVEGKSDHEEAESVVEKKPAGKAEAEKLIEYANFLWLVKKDLGAAEETYLEAIAADPTNTTHAANYAHFLWNTGGEDTCYPLGQIEDDNEDDNE